MRTTPQTLRVPELRPVVRSCLGALAAGWQAAAVWVVWAVVTVQVAGYVARHGHDLPTDDEWAFVKVSYASFEEQFRWLGERHMEHRFPLGRVLYLGLLHLTGHDYRVGMWVTVGILAATAALLVLAARRLRGRTVLADAVFPLLFLHGAHTENLLMGYQIVFTLTVLALGAFALVVANSAKARPRRTALAGAACLLVIANGGWQGLLFVPFVGLWSAAWAWRALRTDGERGHGLVAALGVFLVATYLGWSGWVLVGDMQYAKERAEALGTDARVRAIAETLGIGIGVAGARTPVGVATAGWVLLGVQAVTAAVLAWVAWRRPDRRSAALGLLAVMLGVWMFAFAIGYSRGSGFASRYTTFTALGAAMPFLLLARCARRSAWPTAAVVVALAVYMIPGNARHAKAEGKVADRHYRSVVADARAGMPMDVFADRHNDFCFSTHEGWFSLWENKFSLLRDVPPPVEGRQLVNLKRWWDSRREAEGYTLNRYRVDFDGVRQVSFVKVKFTPRATALWEPIVFEWPDPVTGEVRRSVVRGWVRPEQMETAFWIDGPVATGELLIGRPDCRIKVDSIGCVLRGGQ